MKLKTLLFLVLGILLVAPATSRTTFGTGSGEPLPNITEISIYDVTGLSDSQKEIAGDLEDSGINETFLVNQSESWRQYRFSFKVVNDGDTDWSIADTDNMTHYGLDSSWSVDKIWYNISQDFDGGTFSNGNVKWNTGNGGTLAAGETMYAKYLVNISLSSSQDYSQNFTVNDTSNNAGSFDRHILDANKLGWLNVTLFEPPNDTAVTQNETFRVNASVKCENGECGSVTVSPRYNESDATDTVIPESSGDPFFTNSSSSKTCSSDLAKDETCLVDWFVNSTGTLESWHLVDANASSSFSQVSNNDSSDHLVQINTALIISLGWDTVRFGVLDPGSDNRSAVGNNDLKHNLTVDEDSDPVDKLWIRATDLEAKTSDYNISAENMSYSLQNDISTENFLSNSFQLAKTDISPGSILNFFFWIDVPTGKAKGEYNGTMYFKVNSTG